MIPIKAYQTKFNLIFRKFSMHDVFISYKRKNNQCQKDEAFALNLYQKLTDQGGIGVTS
jgi:hypothetical protein